MEDVSLKVIKRSKLFLQNYQLPPKVKLTQKYIEGG